MAGRRKKKLKLEDLPGQPEATAPLDGAALLAAAQPVLARLRDDLLERAEGSPGVTRALKARHAEEKKQQRTADGFAVWQRNLVTQVAASWLLSCVFVRTLEDRGLLDRNRLAGPGALDSQRLFFELAPSLTERDYLLTVFRELSRFPAAEGLFSPKDSLVWKLAPSAEAAKELLRLFRTPNAEEPAFRFGQASTRFLGDLYQDLDEDVRKRFALLQTPDFVEEFILDRTLERAIERFGLDDTDLIDPTCGSGHFLLGAFDRLFEHRLRAEPGIDARVAAERALDAVYGADINPYAVAIARFRLTLAYLEKAGFKRLADAPALPLHLVVADSLLHNPQHAQGKFEHVEGQSAAQWSGQEFALEDEAAAWDVLHRQYAAVVGNPPYITPKDRARRALYRDLYVAASMQYSLAAPFCERFFQLARSGGLVGQITANSFMKREFGKKLIEDVLPGLNVDLILNTSGAYIPGHGTPTVLIFGTNEQPQAADVLVALAKRGEPSTPEVPADGAVWSSIAGHWADQGFENDFISVASVARDTLATHPWTLAGGGATELKALLEDRAQVRLGELVVAIGRVAHTGNDEAYVAAVEALRRQGLSEGQFAAFVEGEVIRDWALAEPTGVVFPYAEDLTVCDEKPDDRRFRWLWPYRTMLWERREPQGTHREIGLTWHEFSRFHPERFTGPGIAFAFVATHNHFVLDRGGKVFNRSAPIIKLPETATEDDHLALIAYLNSSTACFWMKQVFYPKATTTGDISTEKGKPEANRYEFAGTGMLPLPIPKQDSSKRARLVGLARQAGRLATERESLSARAVVERIAEGAAPATVSEMEQRRDDLQRQLVAVQEDIDWYVYFLFGLAPEPVLGAVTAVDEDGRPFIAEGTDVIPTAWRDRAEELAEREALQVIERPVYKRLWSGRRGVFGHGVMSFEEAVRQAAGDWLQERAESLLADRAAPMSLGNLAAGLVGEEATARVLALITPGDARATVQGILRDGDAVPYLSPLVLTDPGLRKHKLWEAAWAAQRQEDAGQHVDISVPPKYATKDFRSQTYWRLRGKLNVPKERFISYPGCESDQDGEPVYGWAGWNHLQRAQALAALYHNRKEEEGWTKERLTPMLAGLLELIPWVKQWHNEPNDDFGGLRMGDYFDQFLDGQLREHSLTREDLERWHPIEANGRKRKDRSKARVARPSTSKGSGNDASTDSV